MDPLADRRSLELARFSGLIRDAVREFRRRTGLTVVTTLGSSSSVTRPLRLLLPAVHPRCAERMRETPEKPPCDVEWRKHLALAAKTLRLRQHTCPLKLRCACVPIVLGDEVIGLAKCVIGAEVPPARFALAVGVLEVLLAQARRELELFLLREELRALHVSVDQLRMARQPTARAPDVAVLTAAQDQIHEAPAESHTLINRVLDYLDEHQADPHLCLSDLAKAVGKNEKYVSHLFARHIGVRMRSYITLLRVRRACELLLSTDRTVEQIARDTGFAHPAHFRQSFRRSTGVAASTYREIFRSAE